MPATPVPRFAIVLAGGRSTRMGVDKLSLTASGQTMLQRTCAAAASWAHRVIIAGPERPLDTGNHEFRIEDPPFGGPVAGVATALAALPDEPDAEVLVLAGDLQHPRDIVTLLAGAELGTDGVAPSDDEGRPQYLAARYRLTSLRSALAAAPRTRDIAVWRVFQPLDLVLLPATDALVSDVDTPEAAHEAGFIVPESESYACNRDDYDKK